MDEVRPILVKKGTTIGANATIVCGTTLGRYCFIGAGAVITKDVPDHALMVGNPAQQIGWACECGERLTDDLECLLCSKRFEKKGRALAEQAVKWAILRKKRMGVRGSDKGPVDECQTERRDHGHD